MLRPRTLSIYIVREVVLYALVGLALISVVFTGQNLLRHLTKFLMIGVAFPDILVVAKCVVIATLTHTVPIAFLFGALAAVGRMAADGEITAMRACGLGLGDLVLPVLAVGFLVSCLTWYMTFEVEHRAKRELRDVLMSMTVSGTMIEPRKFTRVGHRIFYVESRDRQNRLERVFVSDESDPDRPILIFAENGQFSFDPELQEVRIRLYDGDLHFERGGDAGDAYDRMAFVSFEYAFQVRVAEEVGFRWVRPKEMTMDELRGAIARDRAGEAIGHRSETRVELFEVHLHRRYALPVAPMIFALMAVPLSLRRGRGARSWGALLCGLLVGTYYGMLSFSQQLAVEGVLPAAFALWCPDAVLALAAALLLERSRRVGA